jgi:hypothetical protein
MSNPLELGWVDAVHPLKASLQNPVLVRTMATRCAFLIGKQIQAQDVQKARVLWLGLSRGYSMLKQAVEWCNPCITAKEQPAALDHVRGSLWRYVMAFSGWECAGRAVLWDGRPQQGFQQSNLRELFDARTTLMPPYSMRSQASCDLQGWLASSVNDDDQLGDFLALSGHYREFAPWILGEADLPAWSVLACLRHLVAHGALSPTKAEQWGLDRLYIDGVPALHTLFRRLLATVVSLEDAGNE